MNNLRLKIWVPLVPALLSCFLLSSVSAEEAVEIDNTSFPSQRVIEGVSLSIQGVDLLRFKGIWKLYTGALYLDDQTALDFNQRARRLEVVYKRELEGQQLVDAGNKNLEQSFSQESLASVQDRLDQMNEMWMRTLKKGDRAAITYIPGKGTSLTINGEVLGWVPGEDFAAVYFAIWFGDNAVSSSFKQALLSP